MNWLEQNMNSIVLGNSYELIKQIPDKSIDLIVTDPPYEIKNTKGGDKNSLGKSIRKMNSEIKEKKLDVSIDPKILPEIIRVMKKINIYIWCNHKQIKMYLNFFVGKHKCKFDIIVWKKSNATPTYNNKYLTDKEYCLYFRKGGYCNPKSYESAKTVYVQPININDKKLYNHPTIKPSNITRNLIENSSKENDIVLDLFSGSGTTCVESKELKRRFLGIELDKQFHEMSIDRLNGINAHGQTSIFTDFESM